MPRHVSVPWWARLKCWINIDIPDAGRQTYLLCSCEKTCKCSWAHASAPHMATHVLHAWIQLGRDSRGFHLQVLLVGFGFLCRSCDSNAKTKCSRQFYTQQNSTSRNIRKSIGSLRQKRSRWCYTMPCRINAGPQGPAPVVRFISLFHLFHWEGVNTATLLHWCWGQEWVTASWLHFIGVKSLVSRTQTHAHAPSTSPPVFFPFSLIRARTPTRYQARRKNRTHTHTRL